MKISQVYVSKSLESNFGNDFRNHWNLNKYFDSNVPSIFLGVYTDLDRRILTEHQATSIIIFGGSDLTHVKSINLVKSLVDSGKSFTFAYPGHFSKYLYDNKIKHKQLHLAVKDYSSYKPSPLGDKIYVYRGINGGKDDYYRWNDIAPILSDTFGSSSILHTSNQPHESLISNFYEKCFVYIKPNPSGGCTSMFELGMMGRNTIGKGHSNLGNFIEYSNTHELINLIKIESQFAGKVREDVSLNTINSFIGPEWLDLEFWKND